MLVTLSGVVTLVSLLQPSTAPPPNGGDAVRNRHARQTTAVIEGSIPNAGDVVGDCVVTVFPGRKLNQLSFFLLNKTSSSEEYYALFLPTSMLVRLLQPTKAPISMLVTLSGIVTLVILLQRKKAPAII